MPAGQTLDQAISTPGGVQQAIINVSGQLKKTVNLTPFSVDPVWGATADEFAGKANPHQSDDVIYGGLGSDWLHGGSGDDAISGAEALASFFAAPVNAGNVLAYSTLTGEFAQYLEFEPLKRIDGFLLNFDPTEGLKVGVVAGKTYFSDGDDRIFGDLGNDWLVGGTGRDNVYGGWGDDLLNADDDHGTNSGLNDAPDTHPTYEDRAYGGAGRDVLIANTGGDRLIDWVGEFNSYIVPFAPFGMGTVSRTLQPQLAEYLYALSASDGADPTRSADIGGSADPLRNGEPYGELGVVRQQDFAWRDQTGAPADPQAGNIPGGPRDVLRSAAFDNNSNSGFFADSGVWKATAGVLEVQAESIGKDAVSVFDIGDALPPYFEILASVKAIKPTAGWKANSYIIFDYQSKTDFKFAGIDVASNKLIMGHRNASGWILDEWGAVPGGLKSDQYYNLQLSINGLTATLIVDNRNVFAHTYQARVIDGFTYGLNWGLVGVGSDNSRGAFDNIRVQVLPPQVTLTYNEDFADGIADLFTGARSGGWTVSGGTYNATPNGATGMSILDLGPDNLSVQAFLEITAQVTTSGRAGFVFDRYGDTSFKFAAIDAVTDQVILGHYTAKKGWAVDAVIGKRIDAGVAYTLGATLKGGTVSLTLNGQAAVGFAYNAATVDGRFGLLALNAAASFDNLRVRTDDRAFAAPALVAAEQGNGNAGDTITLVDVEAMGAAAIARWTEALGAADPRLANVRFGIADLADGMLGVSVDDIIFVDVDAAGHGWFVDPTPALDDEFVATGDGLGAVRRSDAARHMDLLSVIAHELGHKLGLEHADSGVMNDTLQAGERELPGIPRGASDWRVAALAGPASASAAPAAFAAPDPMAAAPLPPAPTIDWSLPAVAAPVAQRLATDDSPTARGAWVSDFVKGSSAAPALQGGFQLEVPAKKTPTLSESLNAKRRAK